MVTFSRLRLRPSARLKVLRASWWADRRSRDTRLLAVLGEAPTGLGYQEIEIAEQRGRLYLAMLADADAVSRVAARVQGHGRGLTALSAPGNAVVILEGGEGFVQAIAVRLGNRLREAVLGLPPLDEDDIDPDTSCVLFPTIHTG